jgi:hypothetical protein
MVVVSVVPPIDLAVHRLDAPLAFGQILKLWDRNHDFDVGNSPPLFVSHCALLL